MATTRDWLRFLVVAAGYLAAFVSVPLVVPFSVTSPWFVFVAMICFLGLASVARPIVDIRMPRPLRAIHAWEIEGSLYRKLGVPAFGRILRQTPLRLLNTHVYMAGDGQDPGKLNAQLEAAEASHFWDALLVVPYMVYAAATGAWLVVLAFTVAQVLVNAYPIFHLRLTRHRLEGLARRRHGRNGALHLRA